MGIAIIRIPVFGSLCGALVMETTIDARCKGCDLVASHRGGASTSRSESHLKVERVFWSSDRWTSTKLRTHPNKSRSFFKIKPRRQIAAGFRDSTDVKSRGRRT